MDTRLFCSSSNFFIIMGLVHVTEPDIFPGCQVVFDKILKKNREARYEPDFSVFISTATIALAVYCSWRYQFNQATS